MHLMRIRFVYWSIVFGSIQFVFLSVAWAVPGPDSVAVIANKNVKESVALAQAYMKARQIPDNQLCLLDTQDKITISSDEYQKKFLAPFEQCLKKGGVTNRIESVLLIRGVPLKVAVKSSTGTHNASLAATLGMWKSTMANGKLAITVSPGYKYPGRGFLAASWSNAFRVQFVGSSAFRAGWSGRAFRRYVDANKRIRSEQYTLKPLLVTMLHGRSYKDAGLLIKSAIDAEKQGGAKGRFLLMKGRDSARGVLDREYPTVSRALKAKGFTDVQEVPFKTDLTGLKLAAFFTGTATLGKTIEGNTFLPGSLVDNLTSFGAHPNNFKPTGQSQVSIARWVTKGVAGVHGTTDEPLNNCFPSRQLLLDYVDGSTLAEAFFRRMPYVYWRNLVLGDPMAAPYALRPKVTIQGVKAGETFKGARKLTVTAVDPGKRGISKVVLLVNGKVVAQANGAKLEKCVVFPAKKNIQILAVAQAARGAVNNRRKFEPKGWLALRANPEAGGSTTCGNPPKPEPKPEPLPEPKPEPMPAEKPRTPEEASAPVEPKQPEPPSQEKSEEVAPTPDETSTLDAAPDTNAPGPETNNPPEIKDPVDTGFAPPPDPMGGGPDDTGGKADSAPAVTGCGCQSASSLSLTGSLLLYLFFMLAFVVRKKRTA